MPAKGYITKTGLRIYLDFTVNMFIVDFSVYLRLFLEPREQSYSKFLSTELEIKSKQILT